MVSIFLNNITYFRNWKSSLLVKYNLDPPCPLAGDMASEYLYELMKNLGCPLEEASLASMISFYGKQKKLAQAQKVFASIADSSTDGKLISGAMIDAYITCSRDEDAYLFCREQATRGHNLGPISISILVKSLTSCGKRYYPFNVFWSFLSIWGVLKIAGSLVL